MAGIWRYHGIEGGKYLVQRRDGTVPEWPYFVIGAKDPAASAAILAYAEKAESLGFDPEYVSDLRKMAQQFKEYRHLNGEGDPDGKPHRKDDPETVSKMNRGA